MCGSSGSGGGVLGVKCGLETDVEMLLEKRSSLWIVVLSSSSCELSLLRMLAMSSLSLRACRSVPVWLSSSVCSSTSFASVSRACVACRADGA